MISGIEIRDTSGAAAAVDKDFLHHTFGAQVAIAGSDGLRNHRVLRSVLRVDFAGEAYTPAATHAGTSAVVRNRVAQHRNVKRMEAQALGGGLQQKVFRV